MENLENLIIYYSRKEPTFTFPKTYGIYKACNYAISALDTQSNV